MSRQLLARLPNGETHAVQCQPCSSARELACTLQEQFGLPLDNIYLHDGIKAYSPDEQICNAADCAPVLHVCLALRGGKGGYGNQLRALGRKGGITDNIGDCRDLSGRRLRDVQAMEEAARWRAAQAERDAQKAQEKEQINLEKAQRREAESQEVHEMVVQHVKRAATNVNKSVAAGMGEACKAEQDRKRQLEARSDAVRKRAKVFGLDDEDPSSDDDSSTDEDASQTLPGPSSATKVASL